MLTPSSSATNLLAATVATAVALGSKGGDAHAKLIEAADERRYDVLCRLLAQGALAAAAASLA